MNPKGFHHRNWGKTIISTVVGSPGYSYSK